MCGPKSFVGLTAGGENGASCIACCARFGIGTDDGYSDGVFSGKNGKS